MVYLLTIKNLSNINTIFSVAVNAGQWVCRSVHGECTYLVVRVSATYLQYVLCMVNPFFVIKLVVGDLHSLSYNLGQKIWHVVWGHCPYSYAKAPANLNFKMSSLLLAKTMVTNPSLGDLPS